MSVVPGGSRKAIWPSRWWSCSAWTSPGNRRSGAWWRRRRRLWHLAVEVAADDEGDRLADRSAVPEHVQAGQILRIEAQLDAPTDQGHIDAVVIAGQRDRRGAGDAPHNRPAERLAQQGRFDRWRRTQVTPG